MNDMNHDEPVEKKPEASVGNEQTLAKPKEPSMTIEDEEILLNRLRELGYVE